MTTLATETWSGTNGAAWPAQWTRYTTAGTGDQQSGQGRIVTAATAYAGGLYYVLTGMPAATDTDVVVTYTTPAALAEMYVAVGLRGAVKTVQDGDYYPASGYWLELVPNSSGGTVSLQKADGGGANTSVVSPTAFTWAPSTAYKVRVQAVGSTVRARVWPASSAEPSTWTLSATDTSFTSGRVYFSASAGAAATARTVLLDDLTVTDAATSGTVTVTGATAAASGTAPAGSVSAAGTVVLTVAGATASGSATARAGAVTVPGLSLTLAPDPGFSPPRVRIDVSDTRATPATSLTINRRDATGRTYPVRTATGGPLVLSGGKATIYDYEAPYGTQVTYSTSVTSGPTATTLLDADDVWLIHIGVPTRSVRLDKVTALGENQRPTSSGMFQILDRPDPIPVSSGARPLPTATLGVRTLTDAQRRAMDLLLDDDAPVLLNLPASKQWGVDTCYLSIRDVQAPRTVRVGAMPYREWQMPYQVIGRPGGGTQAAITWADVAAKYPTWQAILDAGITSWAQLAAPTD